MYIVNNNNNNTTDDDETVERRDRDTDTTWRLVKNCSFPIRKRVQHDDGDASSQPARQAGRPTALPTSQLSRAFSYSCCCCCRCCCWCKLRSMLLLSLYTFFCSSSFFFFLHTQKPYERTRDENRERRRVRERARVSASKRRRSQACSTVVSANSALLTVNSCSEPKHRLTACSVQTVMGASSYALCSTLEYHVRCLGRVGI